MTYLHTKFHLPGIDVSLIIAIKLEAKKKRFVHPQFCYF